MQVALSTGETLQSLAVIGADGANSVIRRSLSGERNDWNRTYAGWRAYVSGSPSDIHGNAYEFYFRQELLPGYAWLFPGGAQGYNAGVVLPMARLRTGASIRTYLQEFLEITSLERRIRIDDVSPRGALLPLADHRFRFVFDRALLVGDAAGLIHPITGEGIDCALESGEAAGRVILEGLRERGLSSAGLAPYAATMDRRFLKRFRKIAWYRRLCFRPELYPKLQRFARSHPEHFADLFIGGSGSLRVAWPILFH